jgi:cell division protein FtsQ
VVRRPHLSLVPANGLRVGLRAPSARTLAVLGAVAAAVGLAYLAARETPLFAVRDVRITGGPPDVRQAVRDAAEPFLGESLVALDGDELRRVLEALPTVRSLEVDRAFPHTLRIAVVPERPLAVLRHGGERWLLSAAGRVMGRAEGEEDGRARIGGAETAVPAVGGVVESRGVRAALETLRLVPDDFPVPVKVVRTDEDAITLVLAGETELRLGERRGIRLKLEVAARVLHALEPAERLALAYLDVTVPERPVGAPKPQLSTRA